MNSLFFNQNKFKKPFEGDKMGDVELNEHNCIYKKRYILKKKKRSKYTD